MLRVKRTMSWSQSGVLAFGWDGRVRLACPVLAFMVVGFGTLGLRGIGGMASYRFRVYFFALGGLVYSLILHGIGWIGFDIGTLRVGIGIFIRMARRGLGSFSEKMKGYGICSVFYACPA